MASRLASDRGEGSEDGDRSVCSTQATTASLSSRIASLAIDFDGTPLLGVPAEEEEYDWDGEEEREEVVEVTEEELLQMLDREEPPFRVST